MYMKYFTSISPPKSQKAKTSRADYSLILKNYRNTLRRNPYKARTLNPQSKTHTPISAQKLIQNIHPIWNISQRERETDGNNSQGC